ncbi:hypothetical protein GTO89_15375 [Heliobacterium gestii]|uniref:Uncharacterized protein n=1 Tax=Heliomicrobium gestii TaxID=2699 RepID=A0A845LCM5_HELGE|nr:hypothetical protein [Heliomicrobium gestii]MBM7868057.1 hypothetical protein [Heliomicrobium gestii]MZP44412.1 hypothetical protein [Heliomicrobium gestii]
MSLILKRRSQPAADWSPFRPALLLLFIVSFSLTVLSVFAYDLMVVKNDGSWASRYGKDMLDRPIAPGVVITIEKNYHICGHKTVENLDRPDDWTGRLFRELLQRYPEGDNWHWELSPGQIRLLRSCEGLCPDDAAKRHLGVVNGVVAVIVGPPGCFGGIDRLTHLPAERLPAPVYQLAQRGWLDGMTLDELSLLMDGVDGSNSHKEKESSEGRRKP